MVAASTDSGNADVALFAGRTGDVAVVHVETPAYALSLHRRGEAWVARDHGDFPARAQSVANLLASLAAMRLEARKTRMPAHFPELGVADRLADATSKLISFEIGDGASAGSWLFGKRSNSASFDQTGATFVRRPGEVQAWLAQGAPNLPSEFSGWFGELPAFAATEVVRVRVREGGSLVFAAQRDADGRFARTDAPSPAANDTNVKRIAQSLVGAGFDDVQADNNAGEARRSGGEPRGGLLRLDCMGRGGHTGASGHDAIDGGAGIVALLALGVDEANALSLLLILAGVDGSLLWGLLSLRGRGLGGRGAARCLSQGHARQAQRG